MDSPEELICSNVQRNLCEYMFYLTWVGLPEPDFNDLTHVISSEPGVITRCFLELLKWKEVQMISLTEVVRRNST